ncbi:cytochrome c biogenesis protein ResB [Bdellovibrio sp. HCB185ZH]|uniref:cytochrome c biogenesis protein ResB n=1 Tax=Bdellovibrio sp. HCB185ZH TaxID=3394235 RepID=UPI0039A771C0
MRFFKKLLKFYSSLQLAVVILLLLAILTCLGTLVESRLDSQAAQVFVYRSLWMNLLLGNLVLSLCAVMVDRWPWKPKHAAFICAHVGVITIITGAMITQWKGVDGTVRLTPGESQNSATVAEAELTLYRSPDGAEFEKVYADTVHFLKNPITPEKPFIFKTSDADIEIVESVPYAQAQMEVVASEIPQSGAGLRFQIKNERIHSLDWLVQRNIFETVSYDMGPLLMTMGGLWQRNLERNEIRLVPDQEKISYAFYKKNEKDPIMKGSVAEGGSLKTPWMGLEFRVLRFFPKAEVRWDVRRLDHPSPKTSAAILVKHRGNENWLFQNDVLKMFTEKHVYILSYRNRQVDLGFPLSLKDFRKAQYPGSERAMAYESTIQYGTDKKETVISMNEPLKYQGFTIYQAGFEPLPNSSKYMSVLSVNYDPGRPLKYLGAFIMCLGIVLLFYFRKAYRKESL